MEEMECDHKSKETSDSSDEADEQEDKELANVSIYKSQIKENALNYDAYVGLIQCLRKLGELLELREAREAMNKVYPLSPGLWMDWVSDEQKICTTDTERRSLIELFKRSVKEYMSIPIWVEYIMFMLGGGNMTETRQVCEEALTAVGIHLAEGVLVWEAVVLVEQQYFLSLPEDTKEKEEQRKRVQNIYRRQARVPLMNLNKTEFLTDAEKFFDGPVDSQLIRDLDNSYKKTQEKLSYEENLLRSKDETEKIEAYRKYIDYVRANDNPAVIQNIYERTVTDVCLNSGFWEEYVKFVLEQFSSAHYIILPVCERSQANCPWSSVLFELHASALQLFAETIGKEEVRARIKKAIEKILESGISSEVEVIKAWMTYLVYLRRVVMWDEEPSKKTLDEFREACSQAIDFIEETFGEEGDRECTIARFQARVEAESAKDIEASRTIWNEHIMKRNNNFKNPRFWIEFINLERYYGNEKHCRKLYRRSLERVWDEVEVIGSSFLQFEQELGTVETMMDFDKRYRDRLSVVQKKRMENAMREENKREKQEKNKGKGKEKLKEHQSVHSQPTKSSPKKIPQPSIQENIQDSDSPKGKKRNISEVDGSDLSPPPGYKKAREENIKDHKKQKVPSEHGEFVAHDSSLDYRSVFLSNLDYNAKEEEILDVFKDCGGVETFRIAKDFRGRSKGFGYLVFADAASVPKALLIDRTPVGVRPLFVSLCNPSNRNHAFKFSAGAEKDKLFVRGLPFSMTEDEVKAAFEPHGKIKAIRLVTHRNGHSKGTCYIDYYDAEAAENVRQKMDQMILNDHKITVLISNPSVVRLPKKEAPLGPTSSSSGNTGRQRPKLSLVPRALLRASAKANGEAPSSANENSDLNGGQSSTGKSNEDFRKMFLK